MSGSIEK